MKLQIDTDGAKPQVALIEVGWGVQDVPGSAGGEKLLVFGDPKLDIVIPLSGKAAGRIAGELAKKAVVLPGAAQVQTLRKDPGNGR